MLKQELSRHSSVSLHSTSHDIPPSPVDASLSFHATAQASFPTCPSTPEYELMMTHPNCYVYRQLPDVAGFKSLHTRRIECILGTVPFNAEPVKPISSTELSQTPHSHLQFNQSLLLSYSQCLTGSNLRLTGVDVSAWCAVPVPIELADRLIASYFEIDHPILGHFDPDLFLNDLLHHRTEFCSALLVTSLLLWASHGYSLTDQRALILKSALYNETIRLWELERHTNSINTLAAGMFLRLSCTISGDEELGRSVISDIYQMSQRLELHGPVNSDPDIYANMHEPERKWYRARAYAAWGIFNFITLHSLSYGPPMMRQLPKYMMPGDAYTWPLPTFMGSTFPKLCKLWLLVNEIALAYFTGSQVGQVERASIEFADHQYQRLLKWAEQNGPLIGKWDRDAHHQCYIHIMFHVCVLELFRPFLGMDIRLKTFGRQTHTPRSIYLASTHQLYCQVLVFPLIHPSATFIWWWYGICQAANAAMTTLEDPNSQQMFLLSLLCLHDLSVGFPVMSNVIAGLLRIATRQGVIHKNYARHLYERLGNDERMSVQEDKVGIGFSIDLSESLRGSESASVSQLARNFENIVLHN